jgi:hypothetical protein
MTRQWRLCVATGVLALVIGEAAPVWAGVVAGSGDVPPVSGAAMGRDAVRRGVQGPAGLFTARFLLLVSANKGQFGKPTSLVPDLYYSVSDNVQIGLVHTGPMGWQTLPGGSLCLSGTSNGCSKVYNNVGFDFMYGLLYGDFHLSFHSSLYILPISDPTGVIWTFGLAGKFHFTDAVALFFDPQIGVVLSHRDFYKDRLYIPVELQFQLSPGASLKVLSGITGQLSELGNTYAIPLGLGIVGNVNSSIDLGVRFSFDNLLGKEPVTPPGASRTDARSIGLLLTLRV